MLALYIFIGLTQIIGTCVAASNMDNFMSDYAVHIGVGVGIAAVGVLGFVCFRGSKTKPKPVKRQGSVRIKIGSVSEMAQAFDKASSDQSPVITGRQKVRQRVKDDVFE